MRPLAATARLYRYAFVALKWGVVAYLVALGLCRLSAAPIPRSAPPPALTSELLVGTWGYSWGSLRDGEITFKSNGEYTSHHGLEAAYWGNWTLTDGALELLESRVDESGLPVNHHTRYAITLSAQAWPALAGEARGGVAVRLSGKRP